MVHSIKKTIIIIIRAKLIKMLTFHLEKYVTIELFHVLYTIHTYTYYNNKLLNERNGKSQSDVKLLPNRCIWMKHTHTPHTWPVLSNARAFSIFRIICSDGERVLFNQIYIKRRVCSIYIHIIYTYVYVFG